MTTAGIEPKEHRYKGWIFKQLGPRYWIMMRWSDGFRSWHHTYAGCKAFISLHGNAANPDSHYENSLHRETKRGTNIASWGDGVNQYNLSGHDLKSATIRHCQDA